MTKLKGVISPMVTPLDSKMNIDEEAVRRLVDRLINKGLNGLFLLGTQGEFPMIINSEKRRLIKIAIDEVKGRIPVLANISDLGERKTTEVYNTISDLGVDAYILTPPGYYNVRDDGELINYYKHFSSITNRPVFIYDSSYTNSTIPTNVLLELSKEKILSVTKPLLTIALSENVITARISLFSQAMKRIWIWH